MKRHLFTSSSKLVTKALSLIALTVVLFFLLDRLVFALLFPFYDQWLRVGGAMKSSDIMLVGSSHIEADLDIKLMALETGESVSLFSVPGASIVPRYYAIKQRLELPNVAKPSVIILETSRLVFHPNRYNDDVSEYLNPYWHRGLFDEYVEKFSPLHRDWFWQKTLESYSLNGAFARFMDPANIFRYFAEKILSPKKYFEFRAKVRGSQPLCFENKRSEDDPRPAQWDALRKASGLDGKISPEHVQYLKKIMDLVLANHIRLIFFDPPFFRFRGEERIDGFENVRALLNSMAKKPIQISKLSVPNDPCLFADEGHLTNQGQEILTNQFVDEFF